MTSSISLTGEQQGHKVAAVFNTEIHARGAAKVLCGRTSVTDVQISVLSPGDLHQGSELEPDDQGIWQTLVRAHIGLGAGGAVAGFVAFLILSALGIGFIAQNALVAASVLAALGLMLGLMLAGAVTIRPDHMPYLIKTQSALRKGKYILAVHAANSQQLQEAKSLLDSWNVKTVQTI
ncbi:hypothetical protein [Marinobacter sp. ATCH36]|uniref:hypothetical protein n=1 Tax=Marinobacter sp. ATCH36 TaxID=2945106 RepID=UPI0020215B8C|nr:hypothetical protein [Marinobacter sp. ATCH36]MCL7944167.1 hypothetical protein [Marinobacter sp. ATCH36]